jgi:hypothetical protein
MRTHGLWAQSRRGIENPGAIDLDSPVAAYAARVSGSSLDLGAAIGPYRVTAWLGSGGMGKVYRAHDPRLNRTVAIKILPTSHLDHARRRRRFETDAGDCHLLGAYRREVIASRSSIVDTIEKTFTVTNVNLVTETTPLELDGVTVRIGHRDDVLRTVLVGVLKSRDSTPPPTGYFSVYAVDAER